MAKLEIPVIVNCTEIDELIDELKHLQTYKLFEGDEQVLIDRDDTIEIFAKHIRASAQPEVKPIDYRDCSCALLKMWIENVLTDSEYRRIHGKLNSSDFAKEGLQVPVSYQEEQDADGA